MSRKIRFADVWRGGALANNVEARSWSHTGYRSAASGRSFVFATCPYCETNFRIYVWSLSDGGKRCENKKCGALFGSSAQAYRFIAGSV